MFAACSARGPAPARSGDPHAAQTGPISPRIRHELARVTLWKPGSSQIAIDDALLGGQNGLRPPSTRQPPVISSGRRAELVDGPHADLLRRARQAGGLSDEEILDSPYGRMAARCIDVFGQYFQPPTPPASWRSPVTSSTELFWCSRSYDQTRISREQEHRSSLARFRPFHGPLPCCRRSSPDREPGVIQGYATFSPACAGHEYERRCRTCSTRCRGLAATMSCTSQSTRQSSSATG